MDNNKGHIKRDNKTNAELRKMFPKGFDDVGIKNGVKISSHPNSKDRSK
ncbi:hypothetical protein KQI89_05260 [Clostridium sp. MSJ-4]|uniref:Uncharacterized protein n=1 Tax=Clostridium simiarum TaxID=2841506 RepID=A0ABS6EY57_9CLOT|nr:MULTISPECIES: hypothetical protein [Clostridium]MBU5591166.1 hypothetical protein [Clostridium simiarum]